MRRFTSYRSHDSSDFFNRRTFYESTAQPEEAIINMQLEEYLAELAVVEADFAVLCGQHNFREAKLEEALDAMFDAGYSYDMAHDMLSTGISPSIAGCNFAGLLGRFDNVCVSRAETCLAREELELVRMKIRNAQSCIRVLEKLMRTLIASQVDGWTEPTPFTSTGLGYLPMPTVKDGLFAYSSEWKEYACYMASKDVQEWIIKHGNQLKREHFNDWSEYGLCDPDGWYEHLRINIPLRGCCHHRGYFDSTYTTFDPEVLQEQQGRRAWEHTNPWADYEEDEFDYAAHSSPKPSNGPAGSSKDHRSGKKPQPNARSKSYQTSPLATKKVNHTCATLAEVQRWRDACAPVLAGQHASLTAFPAPPAYPCKKIGCAAARANRALKDCCDCGIAHAFGLVEFEPAKERLVWHPDRFAVCGAAADKAGESVADWQAKAKEVFQVVQGLHTLGGLSEKNK